MFKDLNVSYGAWSRHSEGGLRVDIIFNAYLNKSLCADEIPEEDGLPDFPEEKPAPEGAGVHGPSITSL